LDDALIQHNAADVLPNAPRRTDSGIASKASSITFGDLYLEDTTLSSGPSKTEALNLFNEDHLPPRLMPCDQLPSLPMREYSLRSLDVFNISSEDLDQGNHADTEDSGLPEADLESDVEVQNGLVITNDTISGSDDIHKLTSCPKDRCVPDINPEDQSPIISDMKEVEAEDDTETASLDNEDQDKSRRHRVGRRRKKSSFLVRLFASRN